MRSRALLAFVTFLSRATTELLHKLEAKRRAFSFPSKQRGGEGEKKTGANFAPKHPQNTRV